jgi:hypothetical protein
LRLILPMPRRSRIGWQKAVRMQMQQRARLRIEVEKYLERFPAHKRVAELALVERRLRAANKPENADLLQAIAQWRLFPQIVLMGERRLPE